jgi:hypothetical protein
VVKWERLEKGSLGVLVVEMMVLVLVLVPVLGLGRFKRRHGIRWDLCTCITDGMKIATSRHTAVLHLPNKRTSYTTTPRVGMA